MPEISVSNREFAVATGRNVGAGRGTSNFDVPADTFGDLRILSSPGDDSPYVFSVGDTYTLAYTGAQGGWNEIEAVIIRSDPLGSPDQGAVVFQGVDPGEGAIQIVWTPNFDVDAWIDSTLACGRTPGFYTYDTRSASYGHVCFVAGTPIATPSGPRAVETLRPGDEVLTLDRGPQRLVWVGGQRLLGVGQAAPVWFAPGVLGNTGPLLVSQQHRMLFSGPDVELLFGTPEVLAPAKAFLNGTSIRLEQRREVHFVHLLLETHEMLLADGAAAESLLLGTVAREILAAGSPHDVDSTPDGHAPWDASAFGEMRAARMLLRYQEARMLACETGLAPTNRRMHTHPAARKSA